MKKLLIIFVLTSAVFIGCNDPKDPPDDGLLVAQPAATDSENVTSTQIK